MGNEIQFYVLHIPTGYEQNVCRALLRDGWDARVPRELCQERVRGQWVELERVLIPGYVFVCVSTMTDAIWRDTLATARVLCSSCRYLGSNTPQPISEQEAEYLGFLAPDANTLPPSVVEFDAYGAPHIVSGPLLHLEAHLQHVDLRQRRARVALPLLGEKKTIRMTVVSAQPKGGDAQ